MSTVTRAMAGGEQSLVRTGAPWRARGPLICIVLAVLTLLLAIAALGIGDYPMTPIEVVQAIVDPNAGFTRTIVLEWRLPRVGLALVVGVALAVSGAMFQSLTDNALGSPDVIGFTTGSYTGAIVVLTVLGAGVDGAAIGAVIGGLVTAVLVMGLSYRGGVDGFRLIIVGIALTAMLTALNQWLLMRAKTEVAMSASIWGSGSLANSDGKALATGVVGVGLLLVAVTILRPSLRQLELGEDSARSHGVRTNAMRILIVVVGVALVAVAVAATGPIAFVALTSPQIAARLLRSSGLPLLGSGLVGAFLLLSADLVAQHIVKVPVGTLTIVFGGLYLVILLIREAKKW